MADDLIDEEKLFLNQGVKTPLEGVGFNYQSLFSPFNKAFKKYLLLDERDFAALLDALPEKAKPKEDDFLEIKFEDLLKLPVSLSKNEVNQVSQKENNNRVDSLKLNFDGSAFAQEDDFADELFPKYINYNITIVTPDPYIPPTIMVPPIVYPSPSLPSTPNITVNSAFTGGLNTEVLLDTQALVQLTGNIFHEGAGGGLVISAYFETPARPGSSENRAFPNKVELTTPEGNTFTLYTASTSDHWIGDFVYELKNPLPHKLNTPGLDVIEQSGHKIFTEHFLYSVTSQTYSTNVGHIDVQIVDDVPVATNQNGTITISEANIVSIGSGQSVKAPTVTGSLLSDPTLAVNRFGADGGNVFDLYMQNNEGSVVATVFTLTATTPEGNVLVVDRLTGAYTYTLNNPFNNTTDPDADFTQAQDTFYYQLLDNDGDTATATLTITVLDDKPIATQKLKSASETLYFVNGQEVVTGNLITNNNGFGVSLLGADGAKITSVNGTNPVGGIISTNTTYGTLTVYTTAQSGHAVGDYSYALDGTKTALLNRALIQVTDSVTYILKDNDSPSTSSSTLGITITLDQPPTAVDDSNGVAALSTLSVNSTNGVLANDIDPNTGDIIKVSAVNSQSAAVGVATTLPSGAIITLNSNGSYTYNPNGAYDHLAQGVTSTDVINYTIADAAGYTSSANLTITITGVNQAPVANNDSETTNKNSVLTITTGASNVLSNDTDVNDGDTIVVGTVQGSAANLGVSTKLSSGALLTLNADGSYSYDPNNKFKHLGVGATTTDSFVYKAKDNHNALSNTATVTITITGVNDPPVAVDDSSSSTDQNTVLVVGTGAGNLLANDSDPNNGDTISVGTVQGSDLNVGQQITLASNAIVTVNADGSFSYDPNGQFNSLGLGASTTDSFVYQAIDNHGALSNTATVTINITGLNDTPVAVDDSNSTDEDAVLTVGSGADNLLANDSDIDVGDTLTVGSVQGSALNVGQALTLSSGALLTVNADGSYDYDPNGQFTSLALGASTTDSFNYQAQDNNGALSNTATVTITINGTNQSPVANDINISTNYLVPYDISSTSDPNNIIMNDSDPDGDTLTVSEVNGNSANVGTEITLASGALLTVQANGNYNYDPNGSFPAGGSDSFTYTIDDGNGGTASAQVNITVTFPPVVLDLNDDGISLINLESSKVAWQFPCGNYHSMGWVGPDDGILVYDYNKDGKITELKEFNFASYHPDAHTDLDGLRLAFDSNHDGVFDINDALFLDFGVWQDKNSNGITDEGELRSLVDMGIKSILLTSNNQTEFNKGNVIFGTTQFETIDGKKHIAADVGLRIGKEIALDEVISKHDDIDLSALNTTSTNPAGQGETTSAAMDLEVIIFNPITPHEEPAPVALLI